MARSMIGTIPSVNVRHLLRLAVICRVTLNCLISNARFVVVVLDDEENLVEYFQVTLAVEKGKRLGLVIRGGAEYGLGIFISGVDRSSLSEQMGLRLGDQILSVNGIDFRHRTHSEAVQILRRDSHLSIHLRQMNKLPQPKDFPLPNNASKYFVRCCLSNAR